MSRLECLQAAVDWHIARLMLEHPNKRVSVVLFSSEVTLWGDCTGEPKGSFVCPTLFDVLYTLRSAGW